jgi:NAD(P)-dependent dehydrogenase (short-subunit alcohol dehydrogenase family)
VSPASFARRTFDARFWTTQSNSDRKKPRHVAAQGKDRARHRRNHWHRSGDRAAVPRRGRQGHHHRPEPHHDRGRAPAATADSEHVAAEIERRFGGLDIAFLNAGVARFNGLEAVDEAFYDDILDINVKGVFFTLQKLSKILRPGASVLVTTSVVGHRGNAGGAIYAASKGALAAMVRALAVELAPRGIRINSISPGPIDTPIYTKLGMSKEAVSEFSSGLQQKVPLGRFGLAAEVAKVATFLASPGSSFMTGAEVPVDGGVGISL